MRDIKFRGKDIDQNKWRHGNLAKIRENDGTLLFYIIDEENQQWIIYPETVGQYITKNYWGEFYEGDICYAPDFECNFEIVYEGLWFWAKTEDGGLEDLDEYLDGRAFVVGNIFDGIKA